MARLSSNQTPHTTRDETEISAAPASQTRFSSASHEMLFDDANEMRCDVCAALLDPREEDSQGEGLYIWSRGGEVRREQAPLCPACSAVIFASAVALFDFDDEE